MIRNDVNVNRQSELNAVQGNEDRLAQQPSQQVAAEPAGLQPFFRSSGTPSRAGESNAASSMMKASMLQATNVTDGLTDGISLRNGQLHTVTPQGGDKGGPHTIYINGINGKPDGTTNEAQKLANATGRSIDHIYQESTIANVALREAVVLAGRIALFGGFGAAATIAKGRADLMKKLENPEAARTAANQIISQLGGPNGTGQVRIVGYSQGATISAQASRMVFDQLKKQYGQATAQQMMGRVNILSLGGAAGRNDYAPGTKVTQVYRQHDLVSQFFGDNKTPLWQNLKFGKDILKPHEYMNDPMVFNVISRWERGEIGATNIQLNDPKL